MVSANKKPAYRKAGKKQKKAFRQKTGRGLFVFMLAIDQRRGAFKLFKHLDKIAGVHITEAGGNGRDALAGITEHLLGPLDLAAVDPVGEILADLAQKELGKIT